MKNSMTPLRSRLPYHLAWAAAWALAAAGHTQTLLNVDFGAGTASPKAGFAATGQSTNDLWNAYSHYQPRFQPGMALVADGRLEGLRLADGSATPVVLALTNAPGVWGNATGDAMLDSYVFAPNGSNIVVQLTGLDPGRYHFYLYGWAAADAAREQASTFLLRTGTNVFGPYPASGAAGWRAIEPWREGAQFVVCRDVLVEPGAVVVIDVLPGPGGVAVLNGLQILSRGTGPPRRIGPVPAAGETFTNLLFRSIRYTGQVAQDSARFAVCLEAESRSTNQLAAPVFQGDLALLDPKLPAGWRMVKEGRQFVLHATEPGRHQLEFELIAQVQREEPWRVLRFTGPPAAIATVTVRPAQPNLEVQLVSGTPRPGPATEPGVIHGVLGADRELGLRWQSKTAEATREALVTADAQALALVSPAALRYTVELRYEVLQAPLAQVRLGLPTQQTITKLAGDQVKDWRVTTEPGGPVLVVDFLRPIEGATGLTLATEQPLPSLPGAVELVLPQPLGVQRETGVLRVQTEDLVARVEEATGLRQVNAQAQEFAVFRFSSRPVALRLRLARIEPVVSVAARVRAHLEENRLRVTHDLALEVSRAGIYGLDLTPPTGFLVAEVSGEGLEDWALSEGRLRLSFAKRLLGAGKVSVQLEQSLPALPPELVLAPLAVAGASRQSAFIGAGSAPGLQLKTADVLGAREIPVNGLPDPREELLAFRAETGEWRVGLAAERLTARVVAEVFNLITIGDGLVGGSATIRFGIVNQGVQQFRVRLPRHWRNVEFTGPNIRRRDQQEDLWTIGLQDKAWGGYTLVITYDYTFDPQQATLDAAGAHPLDVEREAGTVAVTSAANLALEPGPIADPLRPLDPTELAATDRALIARPVLLAYRYDGPAFGLSLRLTRHEELPVLDAVADRAQLTSVLTGRGEVLTQAGFMVKNNDRQYQRFELPGDATLWGVLVDGQPVKADRDGPWVLVALPRGENRDRVFAIDLKYAQQIGALGRLWPKTVQLAAPSTDVPGTYVEWTLYVPPSRHVYGFGGTMTVTAGTDYGWRDGWSSFANFYRGLWHDYGAGLIVGGVTLAFVIALFLYGRKRGFGGVLTVVLVFGLLAILAGMMLPALSRAKAKAQRINSANNLKQIGLAARLYATDHEGRMPKNFDEMLDELGTPKVTFDPETGQRYTYIGAGKSETDPTAILAFSPERSGGGREVLLSDGSVQMLSATRFAEALAKDPSSASRLQVQAPAQPQAAQAQEQEPREPASPQVATGLAPTLPAPAPAPTASGIKSLKFDLPKSGHAYTFTRVLSLSSEPPTIAVRVMSGRAFSFLRAAAQLAAFLVGLALVLYQWHRREPRAVGLALGVVLAVWATVDLLIAWRLLGLALMVSLPGLAIIAVAGLVWRWRRRRGQLGRRSPPAPPALSSAPPAVAALLLALGSTAAPVRGATPFNPAVPPVSIVSAAYTGIAHEQAAEFEVDLALRSSATNQSVALFGKEAALEAFAPVTGEARLWREGDTVGVLLPAAGAAQVRLRLVVKLGGDLTRRHLDFAVPPALGSQFRLTLPEPDAEVEFPGAVILERNNEAAATAVRAVLGAAERVQLSWMPRRKRAAELAATVFARQTALVTLGEGAVSTRTAIEWQVSQGELLQVRVRLPQGQRLLKAQGEHLRSWDFSSTNRDVLTLDLVKPVAPVLRLTLETERPLDSLPGRAQLQLPEVLDVKRQTGWVAVRPTEELGLTLERAAGLERIDNAEFAQAAGEPQPALFSAWRFLQPDFELALKADLLQPRLEATQRQDFTVGLEQLSLTAQIDYTISQVGVFAVRLALPPEGRLERVACDALQQWAERQEDGRRVLEVGLQQRTQGPLHLELRFERTYTNLAPQLTLTGIHPLDLEQLTGYVTVAAEAGVGLKTATLEGATEVPAATVPGVAPGAAGLLAFKHRATERQPAPAWRIALTTEPLESWVRADLVSLVIVGERLVSGRSLVRYDIQNAPLKQFRLRTPATWRNVEILGPGVRRRDHTDGTWQVELQNKVSGEYRLTLHWEMPRADTNALTLTGAEAVGVERETGAIALLAQSQLQLIPAPNSQHLLRIDTRELPDWASPHAGGPPVLSFRYLRPGWQLPLQVRRFEDASVLQGLIDQLRLRTVIADDGQHMTQLELRIRNNGRQQLALVLPAQAEVWSAFVDGRPVRPARSGAALLLPLERAQSADSPIPVEMTYVGTVSFPRTSGTLELISPRLDLPLKDARWDVFLPPDFAYSDFQGTMTYESAELLPLTQDFTLAEYQRQELSKQETIAAQAVDFLRRSQTEIASGKFELANNLKNFREVQIRDRQTAAELRQLEAEVNRGQSTQLIEAQRAYTYSNLARYGLPDRPRGGRGEPAGEWFNYDAKVAEQQVAQLQKAQAVAETVVAPLRANLPTRGLRYAFVQVLQTDTDKPLVIRLHAHNERELGWLARLGRGVGGFLLLWLAAAVTLKLRPVREGERSAGS
ncbi:MAG: hypothetical protein FJ387_00510 [Verrucomicrobia bacterium]|nr:hypothetical protein [Verrucomicrobiota bacterium]